MCEGLWQALLICRTVFDQTPSLSLRVSSFIACNTSPFSIRLYRISLYVFHLVSTPNFKFFYSLPKLFNKSSLLLMATFLNPRTKSFHFLDKKSADKCLDFVVVD